MSTVPDTEAIDVQTRDRMKDMIHDLGQKGFQQAYSPYYDRLQTDSKKPLYFGCTTFIRLLPVLGLVNLKPKYGWRDKSFIELLVLLKKFFLRATCY